MDQHPSARSCTSREAQTSDSVPSEPSMNLYIHSTTGTRFELSLPLEETVEGLKRRLSQRLKVPKERLALLYRETRLNSGKLQDFGISDGSKLTLVPTVEAGLMSQASRPEQSVMQALESLTETQVSDFLSGRSPLTLALRVGDHMMFVQLQLAAQHSGVQQLQHRHLMAHGGTKGTMGHSHGVPSSSRITRQPQPQTQQHHHSTTFPSNSGVYPCAHSSHPLSALHSPPLVSGHCSPPPCSSQLLTGLHHHPHQPSPPSPSATSPSLATPYPEATSKSSSNPPPRSRKPGAIIESFVNHAPGIFSGTFSGTLHPNCQDSAGRPRRDINTILQILNDLLSATRHYQGVPPSLAQLRYQTQSGGPTVSPSPPPSPPATGPTGRSAASQPSQFHPLVQCQSQIRMCKSRGEHLRQTENRATRCKVEHLQLLMQQKRLRRKARRDSRGPYQWLPNRKAGRSNSNSSISSEGSLDLEFEESVWKPEVKADLKSEFIMA